MAETSTNIAALNKPNYEIRVGLFTLYAVIILLWGWSWLKDFSFHPPQRFIVQFHDVAGLNKNAPVNISGVRVGTVEKIELHGKGQVYCHLKIANEDNTQIPQGSKVTIQTLGLVGAKYVEISLPEVKPNEPAPPPIPPDTILTGEDPVRVELYVNKIASNLSNVTTAMAGKSAREGLAHALETSGSMFASIRDASNNLSSTTSQFGKGAESANSFFSQGTQTMQKVSSLAQDMQQTSRRVNKILDNPAFSTDLKDTARLAKETAEKIQTAVHELNTTLTDKPMRDDLTGMLNKLSDATANISHSMEIVKNLSDDQGLRSDLKETLVNARDALSKANVLLGKESFVTDAHQTMAKLQTAADNVDLASRNINQVLGHKRPLLHLMFGGGVKPEPTKKLPASPVEPKLLKTIDGPISLPESPSSTNSNNQEIK